jgi:hypothetical protein
LRDSRQQAKANSTQWMSQVYGCIWQPLTNDPGNSSNRQNNA